MSFSDWWESTFSADKYNAQKALKHIKKEYQGTAAESGFETIFIELAEEEIQKQGRLLVLEEIEDITHRARIQARHIARGAAQSERKVIQEETSTDESMPRKIGTLAKEMYDRLDKQLLSVKTTTNVVRNEGELGIVRDLKLKNAQENILKIVEELSAKTKCRGVNKETERALQLEITRWKECAQRINNRREKRISSLDFKEYIQSLDKSFQQKRSEATR